jgi:hypothetical protein
MLQGFMVAATSPPASPNPPFEYSPAAAVFHAADLLRTCRLFSEIFQKPFQNLHN